MCIERAADIMGVIRVIRGSLRSATMFRVPGLARLLDRQMLGEVFARLRKNAAAGIDGVSYAQYEETLRRALGIVWQGVRHALLALRETLNDGSKL